MRPVRQAVNRLERAGYTVGVTPARRAHRRRRWPTAVTAANAWRDTDSERGFSMALGRLGRPGRRRVRAGRGDRRRPAADGAALAVARGADRPVARPDAPRSRRRQRRDGADGRRPDARSPAPRRRPDLAELRRLPLGLRGGRAHRRRPDPAAVAAHAAVLLPLVAAGVALPVEHEVPAGVGAALPLLRRAAGAGEDRHGDRDRGGLRAVAAVGARARRSSAAPVAAPRRGGHARSRRSRRPPRRRRRKPPTDHLPEQERVRRAKLVAHAQRRASTRTR